MDTLTHTLGGALLGRALADRSPLSTRRAVWVGAIAGAFPDSDFILRFFTDPLTFLNLHRGVTHSLILLPLWAWLLSLIFALVHRRGSSAWRDYFLLASLAILLHIAFDAVTSFGTQVLAPFSDWKASWPTTFIIDPIFSGILIVGLVAAWRAGMEDARRGTQRARIALWGLLAYQLFLGLQWWSALEVARESLRAESLFSDSIELAALPQPFSPFHWKLVARDGERYHVAYLGLERELAPAAVADDDGMLFRLWGLYQPAEALSWESSSLFGEGGEVARAVWESEPFAPARRFLVLPRLFEVERREEGLCHWFSDQRFDLREIRAPFLFGVCDSGVGPRLYRRSGGQLSALD